MGTTITVVRLPDRRLQETSDVKWTYHPQLESLLYNTDNSNSTGAMSHLLKRTNTTAQKLTLKKSCVAAGIVTEKEFQWLSSQLNAQTRSFSLVPLSLLEAALATYGCCEKSEALITALELQRPDEWGSEEEGSEEEGEGEEEDKEDHEQSGDDNDKEGDGDQGDNVSIASTEVADGQDEADSNGEEICHGYQPPGAALINLLLAAC